jgi:hypothetical protein
LTQKPIDRCPRLKGRLTSVSNGGNNRSLKRRTNSRLLQANAPPISPAHAQGSQAAILAAVPSPNVLCSATLNFAEATAQATNLSDCPGNNETSDAAATAEVSATTTCARSSVRSPAASALVRGSSDARVPPIGELRCSSHEALPMLDRQSAQRSSGFAIDLPAVPRPTPNEDGTAQNASRNRFPSSNDQPPLGSACLGHAGAS